MNSRKQEYKLTAKNYQEIWPTLKKGNKLYYSHSFKWVDVRWHSARFGCRVGFREWDERGDFVLVTKSQSDN